MERRTENRLLVLLVLSCLLVYPPSPPPPHYPFSVPMPRSLRMGSQQHHPTALKPTSSQDMAIAATINLGKPAARMEFEVNNYPAPGAPNHHHGGYTGPGH